MKKRAKAWQFVAVALLILAFAYSAFFGFKRQYGDTVTTYIKGAEDIRFGIDIKGGVDVTFMPADGFDATDEQMDAAKTVIQDRLVRLNITDNEVYVDYNKDRIIVRFPWQEGEAEFNPEAAINEIGTTAHMVFRKGSSADGEEILEGKDVASAVVGYTQTSQTSAAQYVVSLELNASGKQAFADATTEAYNNKTPISIWLDDECISTANVNEPITDGKAQISGNFTQESASTLANQINSGALPFALSAESYSTISPSLGANSLDAMVKAGLIAFALIAAFMILIYRLPGFVAAIALLGQVAATLAFVSGYFSVFNSFTMTLPGIAGLILAIGIGVDANVITAERIKEELNSGKTLDSALRSGFNRGLAPIIDGNVTIVIVAIVLMGAFGPTDSVFAKLLTPLFFAFGPSTAGTIYSFGYTLLTGVLLNFVFGVFLARVMLRGASAIKALRNPWLYGGVKEPKAPVVRNITGKRKIFFSISACIIALVLVSSVVRGVNMDVQFKGGCLITMSYEGEPDMAAVESSISEKLGSGAAYQTGSNVATGENTLTVTLAGNQTLTTDEVADVVAVLNESFAENNFQELSMSNVNPTIGNEFLAKSLVAVAAALVLILAYIAFRFRNIGGLVGGVSAIAALANDLLVVFGTFVIWGVALNGNFIAALLTILGYSINDTVVVYDRIRENRTLFPKMPSEELVNLSINQSLRRTINTTVTTVMALAVITMVSFLYGLDSITTFTLPLMMGMISGVFTSLLLATSIYTVWENKKLAAKK